VPKRKPSKDWRSLGAELKIQFSRDDADAIARKFHIPASFPLRRVLEQAAENYESLSRSKKPRIADQEKELKSIVKQTEGLIQSLRELSMRTRLTLVGTDVFGASATPLLGFLDYLTKVRSASSAALRKLPKDKGGGDRNDALRLYIADLASIYERATGERPTCTFSAYNERYESPFFDFVAENLRFVAEKLSQADKLPSNHCQADKLPSNHSLGKQIQRALRVIRLSRQTRPVSQSKNSAPPSR